MGPNLSRDGHGKSAGLAAGARVSFAYWTVTVSWLATVEFVPPESFR